MQLNVVSSSFLLPSASFLSPSLSSSLFCIMLSSKSQALQRFKPQVCVFLKEIILE